MNFDDIKKEMDDSVENQQIDLSQIELGRAGMNPVQKIRSNMKSEIIIQFAAIIIFMIYPLYIVMPKFSEAIYYIFMFITSLMTMAYIIKLSFFLKRTSRFALNTKDALHYFIYEAKLTLEVYKSFTIAGSLILPVPTFALLSGFKLSGDVWLFEKWFLLDVSRVDLILLIIGYIAVAILFYFITVGWTKLLYGKYLSVLEKMLVDLEP
jgi:hypothetical protein